MSIDIDKTLDEHDTNTGNIIQTHYSRPQKGLYVEILKSDYEKLLYHYDISRFLMECEDIVNTSDYEIAKLVADVFSKINKKNLIRSN